MHPIAMFAMYAALMAFLTLSTTINRSQSAAKKLLVKKLLSLALPQDAASCRLYPDRSPSSWLDSLYRASAVEKLHGLNNIFIKDDGRNPTASLKDRASAVGIAKAREAGATTICAASTGNAVSSLAGFAASAGLKTVIFVPKRAPRAKVAQLLVYGAKTVIVDDTYDRAFELSVEITKKVWVL